MRKEVLWAVIAGIVLGLIVAFGVWRVNSKISGKKEAGISLATPTPEPQDIGSSTIVLNKPEENDVVTTDTVAVSGLTKPSAWVILSGEDGDYTAQADTTGGFSQNVDLIPGINQIKVTAFYGSPNGENSYSDTQVLVVYSSSFQTKTALSASPAANATGASDIKKKVAQDVVNAMNQPKAYIGTVTDITDSTIQIKTTDSQIDQISISADKTSVTNSTGTTPKAIKTTDIAIGDFIVAMGYVSGNSVLSAQRILVTDAINEPKITATEAKVASVTKKALTVTKISDNSQDTVTPDKNTDIEAVANGASKVVKFSSISTNDTIIYVVTTDTKSVNTVRSIFDLTPPQS